jgi:hypothetical protein
MMHHFRDGFRALLKNRGFASVAIVTLALAIGMTTAIFSVVDAVPLRPVPLADIDRLVMIWATDRASGTTHEPASLPDYLDFTQRSRRVGDFAALRAGEANLVPDGEPSRVAMNPHNGDLQWQVPFKADYSIAVATPLWGPGNLLFVSSQYNATGKP